MAGWLIWSLTATIFYGTLNFLYKAAAEKNYANQAVVLIAAMTVVASSLIFILTEGSGFSGVRAALPYALANGTFFAFGAILKVQALKLAPASIVFPANNTNVLFVVLIGIFFFGESPSMYQWFGIGAVAAVLVLVSSERIGRSAEKFSRGIILAVAASACTSLSMTAGKLTSSRVDRSAYILLSYSIVVAVSLITFINRTGRGDRAKSFARPGIFVTGIAIGILNFFGYRLVLAAFAAGNISVVQPLLSLSILISIFLSVIFFREKITVRRVTAIGLTLLSILLIKQG